jgi:hypothetical protein
MPRPVMARRRSKLMPASRQAMMCRLRMVRWSLALASASLHTGRCARSVATSGVSYWVGSKFFMPLLEVASPYRVPCVVGFCEVESVCCLADGSLVAGVAGVPGDLLAGVVHIHTVPVGGRAVYGKFCAVSHIPT